MPSRRQFAKKGEEVRHFRLVARSQNDSRGDQDGATPLVLEPVAPPSVQRRTGLSEAELLSIPKSLQDTVGADVFGQDNNIEESEDGEEEAGGTENTQDLLDGDCYFPKDGYNYEKHLKRVSGVGKGASVTGVVLAAPSTQPQETFARTLAATEEEAEVIRALENDDEYEELDEGEIEVLLPADVAVEEKQLLWGPNHTEDDDLPDLALFKEMRARMAAVEEADGNATAYGKDNDVEDDVDESCAAGEGELQGKDFAKFMVDEYGEEEVGACDDEEIEGHVSLENCEELLDEFLEEQQQERRTMHSIFEPMPGKHDDVPRVIEETKAIIDKHYKKDVEGEEEISSEESEDESRTWDCETVLSTLSNLSNRPGKIGRIKLEKIKPEKRPGIVLNPVREGDDGAEEDDQDADNGSGEESDVVELPDVNTNRVKGETAEERRQRKAGVKEMRRICRKMKKESKEMYKAEAQRLPGKVGGPDIREKLRVLKL